MQNCWSCGAKISENRKKCGNCGEWQGWRRHATSLQLLAGVVIAIGTLGSAFIYIWSKIHPEDIHTLELIAKAVRPKNYEEAVECPSLEIEKISVVAHNLSESPATLGEELQCFSFSSRQISGQLPAPKYLSGSELQDLAKGVYEEDPNRPRINSYFRKGLGTLPPHEERTIDYFPILGTLPGLDYIGDMDFVWLKDEEYCNWSHVTQGSPHTHEVFCILSMNSPKPKRLYLHLQEGSDFYLAYSSSESVDPVKFFITSWFEEWKGMVEDFEIEY